MAANLAIGAITAVLAVFGGLRVAGAIDDEVPRGRWIKGIDLPSVTTPRGTVPGVTTPEQPAPPGGRPATRALDAPLYRFATFSEILRRLRVAGGPGARVSMLRVAREDVVAQIESGRKRVVFVVRAGGVQQVVTTSATGRLASFPLAFLRPGVPGSLFRRTARMAGLPESRIDYVVATRPDAGSAPYWIIGAGSRGFFRAEMDGRNLRRLG
ncbi:MAG: hypothetical protein QOE65_2484 [Solirubrobacteraceae bacterium]|jgi:hypothetical protein|nr:hypothetical protein [Solirubrobacteraceae bacterium]